MSPIYPPPTEVIEVPIPGGKPGKGAEIEAPEGDLQSLIKSQVEHALRWKEENLDPLLEEATKYYMGEPYGDEKEGRSQVVTREVRNAVAQSMPSIMRVFTSSEYVAEFRPRGPEDIEIAKQQTQTVHYVFFEENSGFLHLHSAIKDALVRKLGVIKWWWEEQDRVLGSDHTGLTQEDLAILENDPEVDTVEILAESTITVPGQPDPQTGQAADTEVPVFDVRVTRIVKEGRPRVGSLPPEEVVWSPYAKSFDECVMIGHVRDVPASELLEMGAPKDIVMERLGKTTDIEDNELARARRVDHNENALFEEESDESMRPVRFSELYVKYDEDGDGIAELHKIHAIGDDYYIWEDEIVDERPFAFFRVDPEPHTIIGLSQADHLMDLQRIISYVTRGMLDSLAAHLNPAMEVVENEVNMPDVLSQELGRVIRVRRPGMMREVETQFVGGSALPVLDSLRSQVAERVGVSAITEGLDPDALQSTTAAAVQATVDAGKQRLEMMTRMLAETGVKDLFKGLLRLIVKHQDQPMVIRLRGEFVRVDPRHWDADKDVLVNVALGSGMVDQKIGNLMQIASKQEQHLQQGSPLVDFATIRGTYARIVELMGFKNPDSFFKPFGPQEQQQYAEAQAKNQKPSDTEVLKEIEMAKIQARSQEKMLDSQMKQAELALKREQMMAELQLKGKEVDLKIASEQADKALEQARLSLETEKARIDARQKNLQGLKLLSDTRIGE